METRDRQLRLLTLGGCNVLEIGRMAAGICQHKHYWNVTWPSLCAAPLALKTPADGPEFAHLREFIARETEKRVVPLVKAYKPDIVLLSAAQNVLNDFVVVGDSVIPDFTIPLYMPEARLNGRPRPDIAALLPEGFRRVPSDSREFAELVKSGFKRMYKRLLRPMLDEGVRVFVHNHVLATQVLLPDGIHAESQPETARQMALTADFVAYARRWPGIEILEQELALNVTSEDTPGGGRWAFHAIHEQYLMLAWRLARQVTPGRADEVLHRFLLENRRLHLAKNAERDRMDREIQALARELKAIRGTLSWRVTSPLRAVRQRIGKPAARPS